MSNPDSTPTPNLTQVAVPPNWHRINPEHRRKLCPSLHDAYRQNCTGGLLALRWHFFDGWWWELTSRHGTVIRFWAKGDPWGEPAPPPFREAAALLNDWQE